MKKLPAAYLNLIPIPPPPPPFPVWQMITQYVICLKVLTFNFLSRQLITEIFEICTVHHRYHGSGVGTGVGGHSCTVALHVDLPPDMFF